jgi:hypothetical protein
MLISSITALCNVQGLVSEGYGLLHHSPPEKIIILQVRPITPNMALKPLMRITYTYYRRCRHVILALLSRWSYGPIRIRLEYDHMGVRFLI